MIEPPVSQGDAALPDESAEVSLPPGGIGIAAVQRDTGISKETLRIWERRYGFPSPVRDGAGERLYLPDQVHRLRLVKRLLDGGHRPGRVVAAPRDELSALLQPPVMAIPFALDAEAPEIAVCTAQLQGHDIDGLRRTLSQAVLRRGLAGAITEVFAPLTARIGELWMNGRLQVFEEHIFSESLQLVLRQAIQALPSQGQSAGPRVLLTTLPGENHGLGLLMAEALLGLEGATCLSLGVQTPLAQLPAAVAAHRSDVVGLSFSGLLAYRAVLEGLASLRVLLPAGIESWAGGSSRALRLPGVPNGVRYVNGLGAISAEVVRWRKLLESGV